MSKHPFPGFLGVLLIFLYSCNLSDFETDRLIEPTDLKPVVYLPVAYGTYLVKDFATIPQTGNTVVTQPQINFDSYPIPYDLKGVSFSAQAIDTMVIIVKTVNATPMKLQYKLSYPGTMMDSGILPSAKLNNNGDVLEAATDSTEFGLTAVEVKALGSSPVMDLYISLFQPDTGVVLANVLKSSQVSIKIGFRFPVNLVKIK
jgi:hypothetical protein